MASSSDEFDRIAFIGLGAMGLPMATNLQNYLKSQDKEPLVVYNRTISKTESLVEIGAIAAQSLKQVAEQTNIIFTSLANDEAVNQVYSELLESLKPNDGKNVIFIEMSTIYPTTIANIKEKVEKIPNVHILCCPVWGPPIGAKNAQLIIITSGHQPAIDHVMPLFIPVLGKKTITVGDDVTKAAEFKLIGNFFVGGVVELLSEGMTLAEKTGIGRDKLMEFIDLFFPFSSFQNYGKKMQNDTFPTEVGFTVTNSLKDVGHMRRLATEYECPLPVADIVHQHLITVKANGGENYDWSSIVGALRIAAGLSFVKK
ncbi:NAD binding domain of 6-phosphogluconate dehydrogenase-domain-containing protein [Glomus cerebriforme]|uniref:NAD binding domain of 6-phosphogluconate dehydrogenase-domain-containing protein n=1 Tax=Glomus cerebriforme TaxID=658196 RepID=A0A397SBU0_9GLOM|nr:NAD binding domain of 6-phosphogluconate dehydrogenase-domain-containing protein [Glomus cerebriforme]